jgi:lipopolysaccharide export LptBFGC system permease protein LptF
VKLWERSLFLRLCKAVLFVLSALFFLFLFLDLSVHGVRFVTGQTRLFPLLNYYFYCLSLHLDPLLALSFLLGSFLVLIRAAAQWELVTLQMSGLSQTRLLRPFYSIALLLQLCSYINSEWVTPSALSFIDSFREQYAKRRKSIAQLHTTPLPDGSELVYAHYNAHQLSDVYWIHGEDLWHMKSLSAHAACYVDHFIRSAQGLHLVESFPQKIFPELRSLSMTRFTPPDQRPLSALFMQSFFQTAEKPLVLAHLHYKLSLPCIFLFIALSVPRPFMHFSRTRSYFPLTALWLLSVLSLFTIFDGMLILAENRMLTPSLALWSPWICLFLIRFTKRCLAKIGKLRMIAVL